MPPLRYRFQKRYFLLVPCVLVAISLHRASVAFRISGCGLPAWVCILSCRASMDFLVDYFLCRAVFSPFSVFTLFTEREPRLSAMLAAAVVAVPFGFSVCISFFRRLSSSCGELFLLQIHHFRFEGYRRFLLLDNTAAWTCGELSSQIYASLQPYFAIPAGIGILVGLQRFNRVIISTSPAFSRCQSVLYGVFFVCSSLFLRLLSPPDDEDERNVCMCGIFSPCAKASEIVDDMIEFL